MRPGSLAIVAVLAARAASADPAAADKAEADANAKLAHDDSSGAAASFREAYAADPRPGLMCNVGMAYYKAKDLPRAERYLDQCEAIAKSLDRKFLDSVAKVHAAVLAKLGAGDFTPVDLNIEPASASASVTGGVPFDEPIVGSRRVWFPAGHFKLVVHAEGFVDQTLELDAKGHTAIAQRVALEKAPVIAVGSDTTSGSDAGSAIGSATGSGSADGSAGSAAIIEPPPPPVLAHRSRRPALIASAVTVGLGASALGFWVVARTRATQAGNSQDATLHDDAAHAALDWQHASWITGGLAGVGAIVTGYLWYRALTGPMMTVEATPNGGAVTLSGAW